MERILCSLGVKFEDDYEHQCISEIRCLGKISFLPKILEELGAKKGHIFWSTTNDWIGFSKNDLESWLVDAPLGNHIILVENNSDMEFNYDTPNGINLELWGRKKLALIIGYAFLDGLLMNDFVDLDYSNSEENIISESINDDEIEITQFSKINQLTILCVNSKVNPSDSLDKLGMSQIPCQPILLELRLWLVKGNLKGPENSIETKNWMIIEDYFRNKFTVEEDLSLISKIPKLPILSIGDVDSDINLRNNLNNLCNERRHESISTSNLNSGKLLRWWKIDLKSIDCEQKKILIPSWIFKSHLEGNKIIHGLTGEILNFKGELKGID